MADIEKTIKHYEALQKRYIKTHNGKACEVTVIALEALKEKAERQKILKKFENGEIVFNEVPLEATIDIIKKWDIEKQVIDSAIQAIKENIEREKGCKYCNGEFAEYQKTINTKISINTIGKARSLNTESNGCPPYANCCMKDIPARSAFIINFCPNCGRQLKG